LVINIGLQGKKKKITIEKNPSIAVKKFENTIYWTSHTDTQIQLLYLSTVLFLSIVHSSSHQVTSLAKTDKCSLSKEIPSLSLGQCNHPQRIQRATTPWKLCKLHQTHG